LAIDEFDEDIVEELACPCARRAADRDDGGREEASKSHKPADDLLAWTAWTRRLAYALAERGIRTREDLAELATDEITDIEGMCPKRE
jgi:N utilization substance protein A